MPHECAICHCPPAICECQSCPVCGEVGSWGCYGLFEDGGHGLTLSLEQERLRREWAEWVEDSKDPDT